MAAARSNLGDVRVCVVIAITAYVHITGAVTGHCKRTSQPGGKEAFRVARARLEFINVAAVVICLVQIAALVKGDSKGTIQTGGKDGWR